MVAGLLALLSLLLLAGAFWLWQGSAPADAETLLNAFGLLAGSTVCAILTSLLAGWQWHRASEQLIRQEDKAIQAHELLTETVATSPDGVIVYDTDDVVVLRNKAVDRIYGRFAEAIKVGNRFRDIVEYGLKNNLYRHANEDLFTREEFIARRIAVHLSGKGEHIYRGTDERWVRIIERRSDSGFTVSVATDLTRIKHTEEALRSSEARFRGILEDHNEFIVRFDPLLNVYYANTAYAAHLGKSQSELIQARLGDVIPASAVADLELAMRSLRPDMPCRSRDLWVKGPSGREHWEYWTLRAFFDETGTPTEYQAIGRDMSQEKIANDALINSARLFRSIAESHPIPVLLARVSDNKVLYANEASVPLLGPTLKDILETKAHEYFSDPLTHDRFDSVMRESRVAKGFAAEIRSTNGRVFSAELNARLTRYDDEVAVAVSVTDTSKIIKTHEQLARQRLALAQSEKLSALGSLLASVSHELNNPLAIVVGQSQLLEAVAKDHDTRERAKKIGNAAKRSARIVKTFLSMVRQRAPTRQAVDLNEMINKSLEIAAYGLKASGIELILELDPALPAIHADEDQLIQVVVNLMINAQHALQDYDGQRKLVVTTKHRKGQHVRLSVADSGPGVAPENQEKIFDAFFTTKAEGLGTGIGLSVSSSIVRSHGGKITVGESTIGGALFEVDLPIQASHVSVDGAEMNPLGASPTSRHRILIIDDEPEISATISEILQLDGYETESVPDGEQALARLADDKFDLVITDLWMPGLDGPAIYREVQSRNIHPTDRIIFLTGDALSPAAQEFLDQSQQPVIEKPFHPDDVRKQVQEMLG